MTETADDPKRERFNLAEQIEEAKRELRYRYGVYAKRVDDGKMTQAQADRQIALMRNIRDTLETIAQHPDAVRRAIKVELQRAKEAAEVELLMENPAVQAVLAGFPDADVHPPRKPGAETYHPEPPPFDHDGADAEWASEAQKNKQEHEAA